jgi:hypothetical protein
VAYLRSPVEAAVLSARVLRLIGLGAARDAEITGAVRRPPDSPVGGGPERCPVCGGGIAAGDCVVAVRGHAAHAACADCRAGRAQPGRWH